jgi:hypothetical protein
LATIREMTKTSNMSFGCSFVEFSKACREVYSGSISSPHILNNAFVDFQVHGKKPFLQNFLMPVWEA